MTALKEVASHIYLFDNNVYGIPEFGACYILDEDKKAIIDCGPTTSLPYVLAALQQLNLKPSDIDYLILTHIHLDHAGGAGMLLRQMPQAKVIVHRNGARHLINPAKLIASVIEAQGEAAYRQNGEIVPIEAARVQIPDDGDKLKLSDSQTLTFYDGLGHSPHELCIAESRNKGVFVGDAVGNFNAAHDILVAITPLPSFDYGLYMASLQKLEKLNPAMLFFPHYGVGNQVKKYIQASRDDLKARQEICDKAAAIGRLETAIEAIRAMECGKLDAIKDTNPLLYDYWCNNSIKVSAEGFVKNYKEGINSKH